jgi:hypothetical protein
MPLLGSLSFRYKIIYAIFAGRRHFMAIHLRYPNILLQLGLIDEVHLWDFCYSAEDSDFLSAFARDTSFDGYRFFKRPSQDNNRAGGKGGGYLWQSFYEHYATSKRSVGMFTRPLVGCCYHLFLFLRYSDNDIFIKADDDTVFIDLRHWEDFMRSITPDHIHFPNIINNDVGLAIQARRNAHSIIEGWLKQYQGRGVNFTKVSTKPKACLKAFSLTMHSAM